MIKREVLKTAKDFPTDYRLVVSNCDLSSLTLAPLLFRVPWDIVLGPSHRGGVTVAGDAFHPMTPDLGQGGCSALEDAVVLARNIANTPNNVNLGIENYVKERRWRTARLVGASYLAGVLEPWQSRVIMLSRMWESFRQSAFIWLLHSKYGTLNYDCGTLPTADASLALNKNIQSYDTMNKNL
ncbi:putative zeaxanthin epoxidase [Dioscorea sansibarensis]